MLLSGALIQKNIDVKIYEVDGSLFAAYYPADRSKHFYYCESDLGYAQPIYHIKRNRVPLCKALGIKVTATVFTAAASQAVAKKAGFVDLFEITYEELARKGFEFPGVEEDTKSSKLMALVIN
ncbi:unnamed protein product, partial [Iphiclides podalirius]